MLLLALLAYYALFMRALLTTSIRKVITVVFFGTIATNIINFGIGKLYHFWRKDESVRSTEVSDS